VLRRALAILLLTLTACSSGPAPNGGLAAPRAVASPRKPYQVLKPRPGDNEFTVHVTLRMVATGALRVEPVEIPAELRVVEIYLGKNPQQIWFYSVSPAKPVKLPDGRYLLFSADLSPGLYRGPGQYQLGEQAGVSLGGQQGLGSGAYIMTYRGVESGSPAPLGADEGRYDRIAEPCTLFVTQDSMTGRVDCPKLLDQSDDAKTVELHWNWERT
jgi:hypothetical protein